MKLINKIHEYGKLVMFSHTVFSLSFALISMLLAVEGLPEPQLLFWILICFLGARTGANALNRVIDAEIDKKNPRTADRQLPQGRMKKKEAIIFAVICFGIMVFGAYKINMICLLLSPAALFLMTIYSYCKRFTWLCHLILGAACACAPVGAWLAVTGTLSWIPVFMGAANTLWVAGFDTIYGCQDYDFDRENGLYSIPARFGVKNALKIAMAFHICAVGALVFTGLASPYLSIAYYTGVAIISLLLALQYKLVSPEKLTNVNIASYSINQIVSIVLMVFGTADVFI